RILVKKRLLIVSAMILTSFVSCENSADVSQISSESSVQEVSEDKDKEDIILTMASRGSLTRYRLGTENLIDIFNEMDNGYKIITVDYGEYFDGGNEEEAELWIDKDQELTIDVIKGGVIDIIPNVFNDSGKYQSLAEKGAFADLNTFIENDSEIDEGMLFSHVLETTEINNQLCYMPLSFSINTLTGKTKYVGSKENWTIDDLKQHWESANGTVNFSYHNTKDYIYYDLLRGCLNSFIDYDNAKCYFDSEEFIELLDFINTFDEPLTYKTEVNYFDDTFIKNVTISGFESYHDAVWNANNDDVTFVGYPSDNGTGAMLDISNKIAISAASSPEKQQGAWEFIRLLISEEYQSNVTHPSDIIINGTTYSFPSCGFPINYEVFQKQGKEQYDNENTDKIVEMSGIGSLNVGYLKKSEYDRLVDYINNIKVSTSLIESELKSIIEDEIFAVFSGELTSAEAANNIQNRASILVSEYYG
ncbi:MAG: extracellular solute-binding protein, partial [Ruminococcus sp.]|nr:extracellular solute-binding protein [Ruminococcus sp.]